jgi:hypothetical protein
MSEHREHNQLPEDLAMQALLYAGRLLNEQQTRDFEAMLGENPLAREMLAVAVGQMLQSSEGAVLRPSPAYRQQVRRRLQRRPSRQRRRLMAGGLALAAALLLSVGLGSWFSAGQPAAPTVASSTPTEAAPATVPAPLMNPTEEQARIWANMPRPQGLHRAHAEEQQRKQQAAKLHRLLEVDPDRSSATLF